MNCRDTESLLLAERDGVLTNEQHASLERHVAGCPACQQLRARLDAAMSAFKAEVAGVPLPDVEEEWKKLRARLPAQPTRPARQKRPLAPLLWFGTPLAAAAALALAYVGLHPRQLSTPPVAIPTVAAISPVVVTSPTVEVAQAEYVEAGDANASTMVYVDKESGWLVVWATDVDTKGSG